MQSLELMLYGLTGVFIALALLAAAMKLLVKIFPDKEK